ncbi:MAG TPA: hypothetical protein VEH76_01050 [Methylocystis sp.]|nr:hypothetical protein [Methylocystis sp.]
MTGEIISTRAGAASVPPLVAMAGERAQTRFSEFFVSNLRNPNTRCAYGRAIGEFLAWCERQPGELTSRPRLRLTCTRVLHTHARAAGVQTHQGSSSYANQKPGTAQD